MRRVLSLLVAGLLAGPLAADQVVLKDGRTLDTKKPPVIRGKQAVLTLVDGKLVSIPASEIDTAKTAALARKASEALKAPPTPTPAPPQSLAEMARAGQTGRKASVVLTDQDVAGGYLEVSPEATEKGAGAVSVGPVTTSKGPNGYVIEGSVENTGKSTVQGAGVTIQAFADGEKPVATVFGRLAKDTLEPGEKAAFQAQVDTDQVILRFTYLPRWQSPAGASKAGEGAGEQAEKKPAEGAGSSATAATPAPAATPTPEPVRSPDYAAPPANAPVGAPKQPGGTYLPPPSSNQPKPPGGGA